MQLKQVGLDKLSSTKEVVATLQEELTVLQPQLVKTMKEVILPDPVILSTNASAPPPPQKATLNISQRPYSTQYTNEIDKIVCTGSAYA